MWIIFIATGALLLLSGMFLFATGKPEQQTPIAEPVAETPPPVQIEKEVQPSEEERLQTLQKHIELAVADGVVTPNEKQFIINTAEELNIEKAQAYRLLMQAEKDFDDKAEVNLRDFNKEAGDAFERFVADRIKYSSFMELTDWKGDKNVGTGIYLEATKHPDLLVNWKYNDLEANFAIECKYRSSFYQGGFELGQRKNNDYQQYAESKQTPVFIALGVGGEADDPAKVFIAPLSLFANGKVREQQLAEYQMTNPKGRLYYNFKNKQLRQATKQKANG